MKQFFKAPLPDNPRNVMRRLGYGETMGYKGQMSYERRIHGEKFPRYHAYFDERDGGMQINLHVDQKQATYEGSHAHSGEYEGAVVENEMARIEQMISTMARSGPPQQPVSKPKKKGFFGSFFG